MSLKSRLRQLLLPKDFRERIWRWCVRYPRLADIYYCFSGEFRREHRAVLLGKLRHLEDMRDRSEEGARYTLRRNVHRLEKGLIMRPRRDVFARDYLDETLNVYVGLCQSGKIDDIQPLMQWANDVLTEYFGVVGSDPVIDRCRESFQSVRPPEPANRDTQLTPYQRDTTPLRVDIEAMEELAWRRRSVRWFRNEPVCRDAIDRAVGIAKLSPSACNRQPFEFRIFDDCELAKKIGAIPMGTRGFSDNFPCVIVIVGDLSAYFSERDRHIIYVDGGLAAMALQFALESQGISSCCINWPDIESREAMMDEALGLSPHQRPIMCMAVGYADSTGSVPYSQKKQLDEIRSYNKPC